MPSRIVSIQIGRPAMHPVPADPDDEPESDPQFFRSAIAKHAVSGPVDVGNDGLEGDEVEDRRAHGGPNQALLAYAAAHYPLWRAEWQREDVRWGGFGENLTVDGADDSVCLGDRWSIGEVTLEVTKPRTPCNRLAMYQRRLDLIQRVRASGRSGWYLRVLVVGPLIAGAEIVWSIFLASSRYFEPSLAGFIINYRGDDLDQVRAALREEGCDVDDRVESSEFGRCGWVLDPEGNRMELWESPLQPGESDA